MLVAVFEKTQIPYSIKIGAVDYVFDPQAEMPDELAKTIVKNKPDMFFAVGEGQVLDVSKYIVRDVFQGKTVEQIFNSFPEKERLEIYAYIKKMAMRVTKRDLKEKNVEQAKFAERPADALQSALKLSKVEPEALKEAVEGSKEPKIKKVR